MGKNTFGKCAWCATMIGPASGYDQSQIVQENGNRYCSSGCANHRRSAVPTTPPPRSPARTRFTRLTHLEATTLYHVHLSARSGGTTHGDTT